jgi:hypothetical protein
LPRDPQTTRYLREDERAALLAAHLADRQMEEEEQPLSVSAVLSALKAPQMWLIFVQFFCSGSESNDPPTHAITITFVLCAADMDF